MSLTEEEIRHSLGFSGPPPGAPGDRRSGRTTSMLVQLLVKVSEGKSVTIKAAAYRYAVDLTRDAKTYAAKLNLDSSLILGPVSQPEELLGLPRRPTVFRDHYLAFGSSDRQDGGSNE